MPTFSLGWRFMEDFKDITQLYIRCPAVRPDEFTDEMEGCLALPHLHALALHLNDVGVFPHACPCPQLNRIHLTGDPTWNGDLLLCQSMFNTDERLQCGAPYIVIEVAAE